MTNARLNYAGGPFDALHRRLIGPRPDLSGLELAKYPVELVQEARSTWHQRMVSEFRSVQIMSRFLGEVVNAGDPLDVYAGALDMVQDEIRHTELCFAVCQALAARTELPNPVALKEPDEFMRAPFGERALHTAISMLLINETLSTAFIQDLHQRCAEPAIRGVLEATLADEEQHHGFGWAYVEASLRRFPTSTLPSWRTLVDRVLEPHRQFLEQSLHDLPEHERRLEAHPDAERVQLGLFSRTRQALVLERALDELIPRLHALGLA